ncbi:MAG: HEAT repeat domain-containing protein [Pirellulaceae bacterium]
MNADANQGDEDFSRPLSPAGLGSSEYDETPTFGTGAPATDSHARAARDVLPPVEPPAAGFIMQLFLIPLLIVSIIVAIWFAFSWLAQSGNRPEELISQIQNPGHDDWQKALTLANILRDPRNTELRGNPTAAQSLAEVLKKQREAGILDEDHLLFRQFLCLCLGEFDVPEVLDPLIETLKTERSVAEVEVRRAALQGIGRYAERTDDATLLSNSRLLPVIIEVAQERSEDPAETLLRGRMRSTAAFVLGMIDDPASRDQLGVMLGDAYPDVRFNAATALALQGDERAIPMLVEMLDPESAEVVDSEKRDDEKLAKRLAVAKAALQASSRLAERNRDADMSKLKTAIQPYLGSDIPKILRSLKTDAVAALGQINGDANDSEPSSGDSP